MFEIGKPLLTGNDWFIPKPGLEKSFEWQYGALFFFGVLALLTFIYAFRLWRKTGNTSALWIILGSAIATYYEPLGDLLAHVTYHEVNTIPFHSAFGFTTPLWVLPCYVVFFGAPILGLLYVLEKGVTASKWLTFYFLSLPGAWVFEVPLLAMRATEYYGANQPIHILDYPPWMAFSNTCAMFLTATGVYYLRKTLVLREHPWLLALIVPLFVVGASAGTILPVGTALSSSDSTTYVNIMALVSMAVSVLFVWVSGKILEATAK
jgi:hypothetical protein